MPIETTRLLLFFYIAMFFGLSRVCGVAAAQSYDAANDFEDGWVAQRNPNGVWSYGYSTDCTSSVALFDQTAQPGIDDPNAQYWLSGSVNQDYSPAAEFNNGPPFGNGQIAFIADQFLLVTGAGGECADLVFTAPADGAYSVTGSFRGADYFADNLAEVAVNGVVLFLSPVPVEGGEFPFANIVSMRAGDSIVFSVGSNQQPPQSFSAPTGLSVVITSALGNAASFGVLSTESSVSFGKNSKLSAGIGAGTSASLGQDAVVGGDIVANPRNITLGRDASVAGTCVTNGGKIKLGHGADCSNEDFGFSSDLATMKAAGTDLASFETWLAGQTPTQTLAAMALAKDGAATIEDTVTGVNITSIPSVTLEKGATLQLSGAAGDTLILNIAGRLTVAPGAQILLTGGLTASQVIMNIGSKSISLPKSSNLSATVIAPNGRCTLGANDVLTGALLCGGRVTLGSAASIGFAPFMIP